MIIPNPSTI